MRAGASGYVLKDVPICELVSAIRMVHLGEGIFHLRPVGNILKRLSDKNGLLNELAKLHSRELEVLKLVAQGMSISLNLMNCYYRMIPFPLNFTISSRV